MIRVVSRVNSSLFPYINLFYEISQLSQIEKAQSHTNEGGGLSRGKDNLGTFCYNLKRVERKLDAVKGKSYTYC